MSPSLMEVLEASDPLHRAHLLEQVRDAALSGSPGPVAARDLVFASWQRSLNARVDPERARPRQVYEADELRELRADHPLAPVLPLLRRTLLAVAEEAAHMMIVTDVHGHILWREGQPDVLDRADQFELVEGACWSEDSIGTNAMGTALASGSAAQIHSAEHLVERYHSWTCAAAPIHDPDTGAVIAAIDLTGPLQTFTPTTLALVKAVAELVETDLRVRQDERDDKLRDDNQSHLEGLRGAPGALLTPSGRVIAAATPSALPHRIAVDADDHRVDLGSLGQGLLEPLPEGWLLRLQPRGSAARTLSLSFLGAGRPGALLDGDPLALTLRHAELLLILALHPEGLTADGLAHALYGEAGNPATVRAEVHRLRGLVGVSTVDTRPYRLRARVDADFLDALSTLRDGGLPPPRVLRRGPLLPDFDAPGVRDERHHLEVMVRNAVLRRGGIDDLWALTSTPGGRSDRELIDRLRRLLPETDHRRDELPIDTP